MKISIIPSDKSITIDGVGAFANDGRVAAMAGSDVHAIQYDDSKSIGHIEYIREMYDPFPKQNEMIHDEFDIDKFKELHTKLLVETAEAEERNQNVV